MKNILQNNSFKAFCVRFVACYFLLLLPWTGLSDAARHYSFAIAKLVFGEQSERHALNFEPLKKKSLSSDDSRVVIVNNALMNWDGSGPVRNLDFSARNLFWRPMTLLVALIFATPVPWGRRAKTLVIGSIGIHVAYLLALWFGILNEEAEISLITLAPFWKIIVRQCGAILLSQISLVLPFLIWLALFYRGQRSLLKSFHCSPAS